MPVEFTEQQLRERISSMSPEEVREATVRQQRLLEIYARSAILNYVPNKAQKPFHDSTAKERLFLGGNMTGKTVAGAKETVCYLLGEDPSGTTTKSYPKPPVNGWACSPRMDMALNISLAEVLHWLPRNAFAGFDKKQLILRCKNGSTLTFRSYEMDITAWQGAAVDFAWPDEQPPQGHYMELRSRVNRRYGDIWITMTPFYANSSWTYKHLFLESQSNSSIKCFRACLEDNTYLSQKMIDRQREQVVGTPDEAARLRGEYVDLQGRVVYNYDSLKHFVKSAPILSMLAEDRRNNRQFSYDRVIDAHPRAPDVCVWFAHNADQPILYVIKEIAVSNVHASDFARLVRDESASYGKIRRTLLDTPESINETELGISIRSAMAASGVPGMPPVKNFIFARDMLTDYIEQGAFYILDTCPQCNLALQTAIWSDWKGERRYEDSPKERLKTTPETHYLDCMLYELTLQRPLSFKTQQAQPKVVHRGPGQRVLKSANDGLIRRNFGKHLKSW